MRFRVLFAGALPGLDGEEGGQVWEAGESRDGTTIMRGRLRGKGKMSVWCGSQLRTRPLLVRDRISDARPALLVTACDSGTMHLH